MRKQVMTMGRALVLGGALALAVGCGQKVSETIAEKAMETALSQDGQKVDVKLDSDGGVAKMTIQGQDGDGKQVNMQMGGSGDNFSMTVQGPDGAVNMTTGDNAKIPPDFPKDIPVYPGIKLQMVQSLEGGKSHVIQGNSADALDKVAAFYKKEAAAQGWTEQTSMNQAGDTAMQMCTYQKGEQMFHVMMMRDPDQNVTSISLTTGQ